MHQSPRVVIDVNHWKRCGRPLPDTCCKKGLNWDFLPIRPGRDGAEQSTFQGREVAPSFAAAQFDRKDLFLMVRKHY